MRPSDVKITTSQRALSAGQVAEFTCTTSGSQPPAKITWFKNRRLLEAKLSHQVNDDGANVSHSRLALQLEQQDHGAQLACRAENEPLTRLIQQRQKDSTAVDGNQSLLTPLSPAMLDSWAAALEDSRTLTVHCK